jgi:hypothetical protein
MLESKDHRQIYDGSAAFHLKFLKGICRSRCRNFKWAALPVSGLERVNFQPGAIQEKLRAQAYCRRIVVASESRIFLKRAQDDQSIEAA